MKLTLKTLIFLAFIAWLPAAWAAESGATAPAATAPSVAAAGADATAVKLPPGDIKGKVTEADGITPQTGVAVVLKNATTDEKLLNTKTNDKGEYVLHDVKEGRYIVQVGAGGFSAVLIVVAGAEAGSLNILIPATVALGSPDTKVAEHPVLTPLLLAGGGALLLAGPIIIIDWLHDMRHRRRAVVESPTMP